MATAAQKLTLSPSRDIPFNKLVLSQSNVRRVKAGVSVEELAEDIARRGTLLQSLNVRPVLDADGNETGMYEVPAGGRRYQALAILVKQKRLAKTAPVPCVVRDPSTQILAEDDSLAENTQRVALHPLDQFRAFLDMRNKGMTEEEIAAAFFTTVQVVRQRLRLATVSPVLLDVYAEDGMTLEMLMAFTVNPDHARQEQVWESIRNSWQKEPWQIRRMLTETTVPASDKRARFIGLEAYEAAGGAILRDLFSHDNDGWLQDVSLLDRLVDEKLKVMADEIADQGWKWIDASVELPYGHASGLRKLTGTAQDLTEDERAAREALRNEYDDLESEYAEADDLPEEVDQRLAEIEAALDAFENRPVSFDPDEIARAGVFLSIDRDGQLVVDRGYVRPEDEPEAAVEGDDSGTGDEADIDRVDADVDPSARRAAITIGSQPTDTDDDEGDVIKPLPERLVTELTAERTLALRDRLANNPSVAFLAVLHKFCRDVFSRYTSYSPAMEVSVRNTGFSLQAPGLKDTPAAQAIEERHKAWEARMPIDEASLWDWLISLEGTEQAALFAHCAAFGVNALYEKADRYGGGTVTVHGIQQRLAEADRLARAVELDMVEAGWRPTVENYLGRVTKPRILEAVREGAGERAAELIDHLKKGDMAREAERLLADTGWLPEPLRLVAEEPAELSAEHDDGEALPDFLAGDDEHDATDGTDEPAVLVAAE
ncbi:ParB family chromosome partitioning protein [Chelatococcus caeni]|uniref:ParB family chromosome partitioning protein n=1 Tax=Chelatococcus caeni TaxID=1348468 RepID=A0A840CB80_9HYPH|nr:ParB N-terminal domain-containing protein [Chelatococcus caeni]MBB4020106.1 ParB family chromosome partitioning protein [Chelatococcus caeni]